MTTEHNSDPMNNNKVIYNTKEGFSQTDFPEEVEQEVVLGQYLESKLGQDLDTIKVKMTKQKNSDSQARNPFPPEIVIVEFPEQDEGEVEFI